MLKPWITKAVIDLLGFEDEVVIDYAFSLLEETTSVKALIPVVRSTTNGVARPQKDATQSYRVLGEEYSQVYEFIVETVTFRTGCPTWDSTETAGGDESADQRETGFYAGNEKRGQGG